MSTDPERTPGGGRGALEQALERKHFVVTAELTSPAGANPRSVRRRARLLSGHVLAANVPDGQAVSAHMSATAAARLLLDEGLEPVLTVQCRDRNRLALQSDLIGAAALGVRNVLCLTGDRPSPDEHSAVRSIFDLDSIGLLEAVATLRQGRFVGGGTYRSPAVLLPGAAAHPFAVSTAVRIDRLAAKIAAGARFVQTQYVFDIDSFSHWMAEVRTRGLHERVAILATVGPPRSARALEFLRRLPDVSLPAALEARFIGLNAAQFAREGLRWCAETATALAGVAGVAGVHFIAPYWEEEIPALIEAAGLAGRTWRA